MIQELVFEFSHFGPGSHTCSERSDKVQLKSMPAGALRGTAKLPGSEALSLGAVTLAAMTVGEVRINGLLENRSMIAALRALRALGVEIERAGDGGWLVQGVGVGGLSEPDGPLDLSVACPSLPLFAGLLAGQPFTTFLTGDAALRERPIGHITKPLSDMGANLLARTGNRLPLAVSGTTGLIPIAYEQPFASTEIKSAVLLAGLHAAGRTTVIEPSSSPDQTERMLRYLGAKVDTETLEDGRQAVMIDGLPELPARDLDVAGDPSLAAFLLVAAALCPGSTIRIDKVGQHPRRTGLFTCLTEMGAVIGTGETEMVSGEPAASIQIEHAGLNGIDVAPERTCSMIDDLPLLAIAAALARGRTRINGLAERQADESHFFNAIASGLLAAGVKAGIDADSLIIEGTGGSPPAGGCRIDAAGDHRIALCFLVLGCLAKAPIEVSDAAAVEAGFPGFKDLMNGLGANIREAA